MRYAQESLVPVSTTPLCFHRYSLVLPTQVTFYGPRSEFVVSGSDCGHIFFWNTVRRGRGMRMHVHRFGHYTALRRHIVRYLGTPLTFGTAHWDSLRVETPFRSLCLDFTSCAFIYAVVACINWVDAWQQLAASAMFQLLGHVFCSVTATSCRLYALS